MAEKRYAVKLGIREEERLTEDEIAAEILGLAVCLVVRICENDAATRKEYSKDRRLRRPYRLTGEIFAL